MKQPKGQIEVLNDDGTEKRTSKSAWTGTTVPTVFQINGEARKGLCMFSCHYAKNMGRDAPAAQEGQEVGERTRSFSS